jgi:hypothetical protein
LVKWWETTSICPNDRGYVRLAIVKHYHKGFVPVEDGGMEAPWRAPQGIAVEEIDEDHEIRNPFVRLEGRVDTPRGTPPGE